MSSGNKMSVGEKINMMSAIHTAEAAPKQSNAVIAGPSHIASSNIFGGKDRNDGSYNF